METFASKHKSIEVEEAFRLCCQMAFDFGEKIKEESEKINVEFALGRVSKNEIKSERNYPALPTSMMDGYAIKFEDFSKKLENCADMYFQLSEKIYADGNNMENTYEVNQSEISDSCGYVTTGSPIPPKYDTVIPVEWIGKINNQIKIINDNQITKGMFIRPPGINISKGEIIIPERKKIDEFDITTLISLGISEVLVICKLVVGLMSNGDELEDFFHPQLNISSKIFDSNKYELTSLLNKHFKSISILDLGIIRDTEEDVKVAIEKAHFSKVQVLISTGSVSMGEKDYVKKYIEKLNSIDESNKILFGRVNMKPGMPTTLSFIHQQKSSILFFGLSGNPVSCAVGYYLFTKPAIEILEKAKVSNKNINLTEFNEIKYIQASSLVSLKVTSERPEFTRSVLILNTEDSKLYVIPTTLNQLSSSIKSLQNGFNCLIKLPPKNSNLELIKSGSNVPVLITENILVKSGDEIQSIKSQFLLKENLKSQNVMCFCGQNKEATYPNEKLRIGILVISDKLQQNIYSENKALSNFKDYISQQRIKEKYLFVELPVVGNDFDSIKMAIKENSIKIDIIITSGGTGVSDRDITPEVTKSLIKKECTGINQLIMQESIKLSKFCAISRGTSGIYGNCFILNIPGNPNAVSEILDIVEPLFEHILNQIKGLKDFH